MPTQQHTIVVQLNDRPGALYRAIGLIRRRDYNVSSLVVGAIDKSGTSRMVLVVEAADVHQIAQQLSRLIDVLSVAEVPPPAQARAALARKERSSLRPPERLAPPRDQNHRE